MQKVVVTLALPRKGKLSPLILRKLNLGNYLERCDSVTEYWAAGD